MTITEFIEARIAEDEEAAKVCAEVYPSPWDVSDRGHSAAVRADEPNFHTVAAIDQAQASDRRWPGEHLGHVARHDPARVLAECEAKRVAVDWYLNDDDTVMSATVHAIAAIYSDHPDYNEAWRP